MKKPSKVKGCYNCSQRRINCDRGTPCQKCVKKGLQCCGLGTRYRFNNGVASRGKLAGKTIPVTDDAPSKLQESLQSNQLNPQYNIDHMDQQSRYLLSYFSQKIAPVMIAIDRASNGYRDLLLPLSESDLIVRNAVSAVAAFHLSLHHDEWKDTARTYHTAAIKGLQQSTLIGSAAYSNLSTMILLLIEEMITGGQDFPILVRMVKCFVESQGGEEMVETTPMGVFLMQQIRKMTLYSAPLLSEISAPQTLSNISPKDLDFLYSLLEPLKEHSTSILSLIDLIHQASRVYTSRATNMPQDAINSQVSTFIDQASAFNATSPGGHILVWAFFIVGVECATALHRGFILRQLQDLWIWTGFANTLAAIRVLEDIWGKKGGRESMRIIVERGEAFIM